MPEITLKAGKEKPITVQGKFLSIVNADAAFKVESPEVGSIVGEVGRQFELDSIKSVTFVNNSDTDIDIEYETSNIKVHTSGKGIVTVGNEIIVKRVVEKQQIEANATVENGKMAKNVANASLPIADNRISIPANSTVEVFPVRAELNRKVTLQLITDIPDMSEIRIGDTAANTTATRGVFLQGHKDVPAEHSWETETSVFVHNPSDFAITLAGNEEWRNQNA